MSEFISNILARHLDPVANIMPRLPGKFEPMHSPAVNPVQDLSPGIDTGLQVDPVQQPTAAVTENNSETIFNAVIPITSHSNSIVNTRLEQQLNNDTKVFSNNENADLEAGTNIIPVEHEFSGYKKINQETSFEILNNQQIPVQSEIKPITVNPIDQKQPVNDFKQQEIPAGATVNKFENMDIPTDKDGTLHQHISILKQKIIKASSDKKNNVPEDPKVFHAGLIKPLMNDLNVRTNLNESGVSNEQPISSVIKVSIGRIEVRAVTTTTPAKVNRTVLQKPNLTLDEYLKRRNGTEK